jgi:hypothetical protein
VLELPATVEVVDSVAWLDRNATQDIAYGTNQLTQFNTSPGGVTRFPNNTAQSSAAWYNAALVFNANPALQTVYDSANASTNFPSGGILTPGDVNYPTVVNSSVVARNIFYNQSSFDGNSAAINAVSDNAAIATDKTAYIPGAGTAVYGNITNFVRGINGIMVDLAPAGGSHASINANDFVFKVGNDNTPSGWAAAPAPSAISVIAGGGVSGSDRVEITWASGAIRNQWLEVQVLPTANTGLAAADVFFWGNKIGDTGTGTPAGTFTTNSTDAAQVFATLGGGKPITDLRDFNRDGSTNSTDAALVFANIGSIVRLNVGTAGPFAPDGGDAGIASALASTSTTRSVSNDSPVPPAVTIPGGSGVAQLLRTENDSTQSLIEQSSDDSSLDQHEVEISLFDLDDELLHTLATALS